MLCSRDTCKGCFAAARLNVSCQALSKAAAWLGLLLWGAQSAFGAAWGWLLQQGRANLQVESGGSPSCCLTAARVCLCHAPLLGCGSGLISPDHPAPTAARAAPAPPGGRPRPSRCREACWGVGGLRGRLARGPYLSATGRNAPHRPVSAAPRPLWPQGRFLGSGNPPRGAQLPSFVP